MSIAKGFFYQNMQVHFSYLISNLQFLNICCLKEEDLNIFFAKVYYIQHGTTMDKDKLKVRNNLEFILISYIINKLLNTFSCQ